MCFHYFWILSLNFTILYIKIQKFQEFKSRALYSRVNFKNFPEKTAQLHYNTCIFIVLKTKSLHLQSDKLPQKLFFELFKNIPLKNFILLIQVQRKKKQWKCSYWWKKILPNNIKQGTIVGWGKKFNRIPDLNGNSPTTFINLNSQKSSMNYSTEKNSMK